MDVEIIQKQSIGSSYVPKPAGQREARPIGSCENKKTSCENDRDK